MHTSAASNQLLTLFANVLHLHMATAYNRYVSAFITASRVKFMLLHDAKNDDGIKNFFSELHELYIKAL